MKRGKWEIQRRNKKILLVGGNPSGKIYLKGFQVVQKPISKLNSKE